MYLIYLNMVFKFIKIIKWIKKIKWKIIKKIINKKIIFFNYFKMINEMKYYKNFYWQIGWKYVIINTVTVKSR